MIVHQVCFYFDYINFMKVLKAFVIYSIVVCAQLLSFLLIVGFKFSVLINFYFGFSFININTSP